MQKNNKFYSIIRYSIMVIVLGYVSLQLFIDVLFGRVFPSLKNIGPLSLIEALLAYFTKNQILPLEKFTPVFWNISLSFVIFFILFTFLFNRFFCGVICPLGTVQELFGNAGRLLAKKLFKKERLLTLPSWLDKFLRGFKYLLLAFVLIPALLFGTDMIFSSLFGITWFTFINPWLAFKNLFHFDLLTTSLLVASISLIVVLIGSFFVERFYCKYICPSGALISLIAKLSPNKMKVVNNEGLEDNHVCPMNIPVFNQESVTSAECIACQKCAMKDQTQDTVVKFSFFGKKIKPDNLILFATAVFFAGIILIQFLGYQAAVTPKTTLTNINEIIFINQYPNIKTETFDTDITLATLADDAKMTVKAYSKANKLPANMNPSSTLIELSDEWEKLSIKEFLMIPYIEDTFMTKYTKKLTLKEMLRNYGVSETFDTSLTVSKLIDQSSLSSVVLSYGAIYSAQYGLYTLEDFLIELSNQKIDVTKRYGLVKKKLNEYLYTNFIHTIEDETGVKDLVKTPDFVDFKNQVREKIDLLTRNNKILVAKQNARYDSTFEKAFFEKKLEK
ncbi:MAG: 4Fe-4S binding protein [Clostridia bacterium]